MRPCPCDLDLLTTFHAGALARLGALAALFFPGPCALCGGDLGESAAGGVCVGCWAGLPARAGPGCERCDLPGILPGAHCPDCRALRAASNTMSRIVAAYEYRDELVTLHRLLKFFGQTTLADPMAIRMTLALRVRSAFAAEIVVPVPTDLWRWGARRKATRLLARQVARLLGVPFRPSALRKTRSTPSQTRLPRKQRLRGLSGVFAAETGQVTGKKILLVDDIVTTGTTVSRAASTLLDGGAAEVCALVLARTPVGAQCAAPALRQIEGPGN